MKLCNKILSYLLYLYIFLLPLQTRLIWHPQSINGNFWEYGTFSLYATEILLGLIVICWLFAKKRRENSNLVSFSCKLAGETNQVAIFSFIALWLIISLAYSINLDLSLFYLSRLLEGILLFLIIKAAKLNLKKVFLVLMAAGLLQAGLGIWQFIIQEAIGSKWLGIAAQNPADKGVAVVETLLRRHLRAYGSLPHPNVLGGFLLICLWANIKLYSYKAVKLSKNLLLLTAYCLMLIALFLTFSRSAWLAFLTSLIFIWIIILVKKYKQFWNPLFKISIVTALLIISLSIILKEPLTSRAQPLNLDFIFPGQNLALEERSQIERMQGIKESVHLIKKRPLLGYGLGAYTWLTHKELDKERPVWRLQPVHNIYLLTVAELGIVGLILFGCLVIKIIWNSTLKREKIFITAMIISLLFIGLFDHYLWTLYFGMMISWVVLGLQYCHWKE